MSDEAVSADSPGLNAGQPETVETWPHLTPDEIDLGWQNAINDGPRMIGRQIAFALAASARHDSMDMSPTLPGRPDSGQIDPTGTQVGVIAQAALAEGLTAGQRVALLETITAMPDSSSRARALLALAPYLSGEKRHAAVRDAYAAALEVRSPLARVRLLITLMPLLRMATEGDLPGGIVAEALDLAGHIPNVEARLRGLAALAPYLPPTMRIAVLLAILDTIATLQNPDSQAGALGALAPHLLGEVHHRTLTVAAHIPDPAARARALTVLARYLPSRLQPRLRAAALEAIATIDNEHDRAESLAAFAPHLEEMAEGEETFPALLERALALAVGMHHRDALARALVGLQARLPRHLQGEALATVNSIADEHVRAQLLADLAASLPEDLAFAALAVAHDIRQRDARFVALKALGRRLKGKAAERTWLDALAVALALPRQLERVLALADLAPFLPADLRYRALTTALTTARSIPRERPRVRALSVLAPLLEEWQQLLADALADAHMLSNPLDRVSAMIALVPYLPEGAPRDKTIEEILADSQQVTVEYRRARALVNLAPHLSAEQSQEAAALAMDIADPYDRATTLAALLPQIHGSSQPDLLDKAWEAAREVTDHYDRATALAMLWPQASKERQPEIARAVLEAVTGIEDDYDRASGLSVFAPLLVTEKLPSVLPPESQALRDALLAACQIDAASARADALTHLVPYWIDIHPPTVAYTLWCEALSRLSHRPPDHLLSDLAALAPVVRELGGAAVMKEAARVVAAARNWHRALQDDGS